MKGWILYKTPQSSLSPEAYEIHRLIDSAGKKGIEIEVISPDQFDLVVTREDRKSILLDGKVVPLPDFLLPRMGAGTSYFGMAVIRHLERLGVYVVNSAQCIDTVKDKLYSQQILAENNIPVPKTMLGKYPIDDSLVEKYLQFPLVVKTLSGSMGKGVFLCDNKSQFNDLMELVYITNPKLNIILQEFIEASRGKDLRVFVVGGRPIACIERSSSDNNFKANFSRGGQVEKFEMSPEIKWLATETAQLFGLEIAGIDLLFDGKHFKVCEANSSPGFKGIESCCDIDIADEIYNFIKVRLGKFED
ncbi:ATP-grasp domain-containing protein [Methanolobus psychrotolerans]|uniref:ATP-grasp domain-containing protein n=1 Tax=Methanolobus psychrotolerans TaxID=1874706 RepID=UPI000B91C388|nr:RimK family alpha-L-glutamate ligase [Methanolobus psychrotolerans]